MKPQVIFDSKDTLRDKAAEVEKKTKDLSDSDRPKVMHGNSVYTLTIDGTSPSGPAYPPVPKRHAAPRRAEGPRALFDSADSSVSTSGRMPRPRERWRSPTGYEYRPGW